MHNIYGKAHQFHSNGVSLQYGFMCIVLGKIEESKNGTLVKYRPFIVSQLICTFYLFVDQICVWMKCWNYNTLWYMTVFMSFGNNFENLQLSVNSNWIHLLSYPEDNLSLHYAKLAHTHYSKPLSKTVLSARRAKRALPYSTDHENLKTHVEYLDVTGEWMGAPVGK